MRPSMSTMLGGKTEMALPNSEKTSVPPFAPAARGGFDSPPHAANSAADPTTSHDERMRAKREVRSEAAIVVAKLASPGPIVVQVTDDEGRGAGTNLVVDRELRRLRILE